LKAITCFERGFILKVLIIDKGLTNFNDSPQFATLEGIITSLKDGCGEWGNTY
jgi:hypothetical protein